MSLVTGEAIFYRRWLRSELSRPICNFADNWDALNEATKMYKRSEAVILQSQLCGQKAMCACVVSIFLDNIG